MTLLAFEGDEGYRSIAETAVRQTDQNPVAWLASFLEQKMSFRPEQAELTAGMMLLCVAQPEFGAACLALKQSLLGTWSHKEESGRPYAGKYTSDVTEISVFRNYRYSYQHSVMTAFNPWRGSTMPGTSDLRKDEHAGVAVPLAVPKQPILLLLSDSGSVKQSPVNVNGSKLMFGPTPLERRFPG